MNILDRACCSRWRTLRLVVFYWVLPLLEILLWFIVLVECFIVQEKFFCKLEYLAFINYIYLNSNNYFLKDMSSGNFNNDNNRLLIKASDMDDELLVTFLVEKSGRNSLIIYPFL